MSCDPLIPDEARALLATQGRLSAALPRNVGRHIDWFPLIRLATAEGDAEWLISELAADGDTLTTNRREILGAPL